jgi:hypothetical protein
MTITKMTVTPQLALGMLSIYRDDNGDTNSGINDHGVDSILQMKVEVMGKNQWL